MKTRTLAAAFACLCMLGAPAMALDIGLGVSLGANASATSNQGGLSLDVGADIDATASPGQDHLSAIDSTQAGLSANGSAALSLTSGDELSAVIGLIETSHWSTGSLANVTEIDGATYDVGGWINAENAAAFDLALDGNADEIADLQAALASNIALSAWLEANNTAADAVIAIGVAADGSLAVFTN